MYLWRSLTYWIHSILFNSILFYSILFYFILFYSIPFYSILFYSILFHSIPFYSCAMLHNVGDYANPIPSFLSCSTLNSVQDPPTCLIFLLMKISLAFPLLVSLLSFLHLLNIAPFLLNIYWLPYISFSFCLLDLIYKWKRLNMCLAIFLLFLIWWIIICYFASLPIT